MLTWSKFIFVLLGVSASAALVPRGGEDDDEMLVSLVEETGVPGGNYRPTTSI